ncbi:MAG TPA: HlyD family efflux transporter periplasmic adaptor subunit [Devosiaceae bacterium]
MNQILAWLAAVVAFVVPGVGSAPPQVWNGYLEADYVYVAPVTPGVIDEIKVKEGDRIAAGDVLFTQSRAQYSAALAASEAQVEVARANLANLSTGSRENELQVIRASLAKAQADLSLAASNYQRSVELQKQGFASNAKVDQDKAALDAATAQVNQLEAQLGVAELPARDAQRVGAEAALKAAEADAQRAQVQLDDRTVRAPIGGVVDRVFYDAGEMAPAAAPVVSILPPGELKARFFVPEKERAALRVGERLAVTCDGCPDDLTATLTYLATDPEHTPPIIFSTEERARLVFMAEARVDGDTGLLPGQPVTVKVSQ